MQQHDSSQEKTPRKLAREDIIKWKNILQDTHTSLTVNDLRTVDSKLISSIVTMLRKTYIEMEKAKNEGKAISDFRFFIATIENINDSITELNLALDIIERGEHDASIKNYADSRRMFYQSLYRCRRYIEEALTQFK